MADKQQDTRTGTGGSPRPGETLDAELKAEEQRRTHPQDAEAEEELSSSPT